MWNGLLSRPHSTHDVITLRRFQVALQTPCSFGLDPLDARKLSFSRKRPFEPKAVLGYPGTVGCVWQSSGTQQICQELQPNFTSTPIPWKNTTNIGALWIGLAGRILRCSCGRFRCRFPVFQVFSGEICPRNRQMENGSSAIIYVHVSMSII